MGHGLYGIESSPLLIAILAAVACEQKPPPSMLGGPSSEPAKGASTLAVKNETGDPTIVFFSFGADSAVLPTDWSKACRPSSKLNCQLSLPGQGYQDLPLSGRYLNTTLAFGTVVGCGSTKAELNLNNPKWYDTTDISLVDGYSNNVAIDLVEASETKTLGPTLGKEGNEKAYGVFPLGCDICVARQKPPCGQGPGKGGCKTGPDQYRPDVPCQHKGSVMGGGTRVTVRLVR